MGRNQIQKVIRFFDDGIDLLLVVYPQGNIIKIEPNFKALICQMSLEFLGKGFTINAPVRNERIESLVCHQAIV